MIGFMLIGLLAIVAWWGNGAVMICGFLICLLSLYGMEQRSVSRDWRQAYDREHERRLRIGHRRDRDAA